MDRTIKPSKPVVGDLRVPGDKSISHRALLVGAIADGESVLHGVLDAGDTRSTIRCLNALGIRIRREGETIRVAGRGLRGLTEPAASLDAGNSGTTLRLLSGILAGQPFPSLLTGDESLRKRPMLRIAGPLSAMGATIETTEGFPPVRIHGKNPLRPIRHTQPVPSAQVKSAILLAGLFADGVTTVLETVETRDHTERMLGLARQATRGGTEVSVTGGRSVPPLTMHIPGDLSSAVFLICAAALIPGSDLIIRNVGINPTRTRILDVLRRVGVSWESSGVREEGGEPRCDLRVIHSPPADAVDIDEAEVPGLIDEIPALAVMAACAARPFSLRGAKELRVKESDRISLLVRNLQRLGLDVSEQPDGMSFDGGKRPGSGMVETGGDHRMAMAFAVAGMMRGGITIRDADCAEVSFPGFWEIVRSFAEE